MHNPLKTVLEIVYPLHCGGCGIHGNILCKGCTDTFRVIEEASTCPLCGRWTGKSIICGECMQEKRGFQQGYYGFYFETKLRDAMHAFKFNGRKDVGRHLVSLVKGTILSFAEGFDCIIPVPVTEKRLRERGFNQSFIIGEEISRITNKAMYHAVLQKTRDTKDQFTLSRDERKKNIKGAFTIRDRKAIKGKRILLVDDLFTTGYTAQEASRVLLGAKAKTIIFFALARTPS